MCILKAVGVYIYPRFLSHTVDPESYLNWKVDRLLPISTWLFNLVLQLRSLNFLIARSWRPKRLRVFSWRHQDQPEARSILGAASYTHHFPEWLGDICSASKKEGVRV
jgi:hypothetical protein